MKIVLMDTRNGMMFVEPGKYTTVLKQAQGFADTSVASEFRKKSRLSNHNVAMRFSDACLEFTKTHVRA